MTDEPQAAEIDRRPPGCSCRPHNPDAPVPCPRHHALTHCKAAAYDEMMRPSEPIAQGQREAIARIIDPAGFDPDNLAFEPFWIDQWKRRALAKTDAILATLPQPPAGVCREALDSLERLFDEMASTKDASAEVISCMQFASGAVRDARHATIDPSAQEGETVAVPKAALEWLFGSQPDADGKWFGECREAISAMEAKVPRRFWWRSKFRSMIPALSRPDGGSV